VVCAAGRSKRDWIFDHAPSQSHDIGDGARSGALRQASFCNHREDQSLSGAPIYFCWIGTHRQKHSSVPTSVPKRSPRTILRHPTPTERPIKNGPEIVDFRPVLSFLAALANRRLQPLGHLTVLKLLMISAIHQWPIRLCSSLCSSLPNLRPSVDLDGGLADHRLVNDSIPAIDLLRLLAHHRHRN
jgi:hypothetical protein